MKTKSLKFNTFMNVLKIVLSVIFPLVTFPYAARVLGAENMGQVQFSISFVSFFSLLSTLGIYNYAVREGAKIREEGEKIKTFSSEILVINILMTIVSYVVMFAAVFAFDLHRYSILIAIQSITMLFTTIGVDWLYTVYEDFKYITIRYIIAQLLSIIALFLFVKDTNDYIVYLIINVVSTTGVYLFSFFKARRRVKFKIVNPLVASKKHLKPIFIFSSSQIATLVYLNSDSIMLGMMSSDVSVGIYSMSVKIYTIIKSVLNAVIATCIPKLVILRDNAEKIKILYGRIVNYTLLFMLPCLVGLFLFSDYIISILAGHEYLAGGVTLRILSVSAFFAVFANLLVNGVLIIYGLEKKALKAAMLSAAANILLNLVAIPLLKQDGAALTTLFSELLVCCISYRYARKHIRIKINKKIIAANILESIILVTLYAVMQNTGFSEVAEFAIAVIIGVLSYAIIVALLKIEEYRELKKIIMKKTKINKILKHSIKQK